MTAVLRWALRVSGILVLAAPMAGAAEPKPARDARGVRVASPAAVRETVAQIMARQAATPQRLTPRLHPEHVVNRRGLRQNPRSPARATWPPMPEEATRLRETGPLAPQTLGTSFTGATLADTNAFPPDTMGAAGPTQFIVFVNGRIRSFNKATGLADGVLNADPDVFFNAVMTPPQSDNFTSDPRIRYDVFTHRWFMTIVDVPGQTASLPNRVLLAVSDAASNGVITGGTVWTLRFFQGDSSNFTDYDTLGVDNNALYIGANMFSPSSGFFVNVNGYVIQKTSVLGGGSAVVTKFANLLDGAFEGPYTPMGVDNFNSGAFEGYFIGVSGAFFGELVARRISGPGTTSPTISGNIVIPVTSTSAPISVPHLGGSIPLDALDDRLFAAQMRKSGPFEGRLWTAHNIEVNSGGVAAAGGGRNGTRWYQIQLSSSSSPSVIQSGTVFDPSGSNPLSYWIPSINVSGQGHVALGVSVAGAASRVDAATLGRLAGDTLGTMQGSPVRYTASASSYNVGNSRWGDYSYTSVDPNDDMTMWTIQQFVDAPDSYGVRVVRLIAPPPATPDCAVPAIVHGTQDVDVVITGMQVSGSGFFDPGVGFPNHLQASVSGGVTVNSAGFGSPTRVKLNVTPTTPGLKDVTITNPDGQVITGTNCIDVIFDVDLSITKSDGQTTAVPGAPVTYSIVAHNAGPNPANGATVADTPPAILTGVTWTCTPSGGASCTASGSGSINQAVNLPSGETATFNLTGTIDPAATGTIVNTATVSAAAGFNDFNPANNSSTDTDTLTPQADLTITKNDGHGAALPGQAITYTIVASNPGPSDVIGATVTDTPPPAFLTPTWTCSGSGGGTCTAGGAATINDTVNLPAGASVTYLLSGTISGSASGNFSNTASVSAPGVVTDPDTSNNSATDTDPLVVLGPNNDTPFGAKDLQIGGTSTDTLGAAPNADNWFRYPVEAGRSYCVEVDNGRDEISIRDTVLSVRRADTTTVIGTNDDILDEPGGGALLSRVCYIATATEDNLADVTAGAGGTAGNFRVRVVDTTLFCPWFFSGNGFDAFVLIKNTTGTAHNATVRLTSTSGSTLGTRSGVAPANGSFNLQVSAHPPTGFGVPNASGGVYVAHDGPPGSLLANVTSLSFTTGVSFDTPASPRQDNR